MEEEVVKSVAAGGGHTLAVECGRATAWAEVRCDGRCRMMGCGYTDGEMAAKGRMGKNRCVCNKLSLSL